MYVVIRRTKLRGPPEEAVRRTREHVVPLLRGRPGFRGYCTFLTERADAAISVSVFDDREAAVRANEQVREWVGANLRDMLPDPPEVLSGEALLHDVSKLQGGGA